MGVFKNTVICICAMLIFFGGFNLVIPKGKMYSSAKYVLSLVITAVVLSCVLGIKNINFNSYIPQINSASQVSTQALENQVEYLAGAVLADNSVPFSKVSAKVDILEDQSISINRIDIFTTANALAVEELIRGHFDVLKVSVINE